MKREIAMAAIVLAIWAAGSMGAELDPAPPALARLATQRRDAARKTYNVIWTNYQERRASDDLLYRWSLRWLEAERQLDVAQAAQVAACKAHSERMADLERLVRKVQRSGQITVDEVSAAEFYRVEAELWLLQAQQKK